MSKGDHDFFPKKVLYKTQMCKNLNNCKYGKKCSFAHDRSQLRTTVTNAHQLGWEQYQTKICRNYQKGICKFGDKCTFSHPKSSTTKKFSNPNVFYEPHRPYRLQVFKNITGNIVY